MANETLAAELKAIRARIASAISDAEKKLLDTQFGQRIEHLVERTKEIVEPKAPPSPPPAAPKAT